MHPSLFLENIRNCRGLTFGVKTEIREVGSKGRAHCLVGGKHNTKTQGIQMGTMLPQNY